MGNFFAEFFHRMSGKQLVQPRIFNALAGCVVVDVVAQFSAGMALLHQHQLVVDYVVAAEEVAPHTDRPARRRDVQRQCFLNLLQKFEWFLRLAVHFVDKCDYRHVAQTADLEQLARLGFDPARRIDNHDSGVDRRQCPISIFEKSSWPGVSSRLNVQPPYSYVITDDATEMPRSASTFIQSEWARRASPRAFTAPAVWIAPPNKSSFSVSVVFPHPGEK